MPISVQEFSPDVKPTFMEQALDSPLFQRMVNSNYLAVRALAVSVVVGHAFSKTIGHPEYLDQL